ncbi:hypothetical protein K435DRAFT_874116 [Dendrothele bispora CBS 962.96]|uniref:Uncharacterized protein n=1 Tax=Dendrothele bispora (strain CBS 962.96) TaxID=1314807 RepID=A0A4S8KXP9_DENBC|nr:hypothetical protein K435DRAFT_874116 [Dendrothele bispora CBS 962.96]
MADLTILRPVPIAPLHPSLQASRPSLFKNYMPGASTSRLRFSSSPDKIPSSRSRTRTRNTSSDTEATEETDSSRTRIDDYEEGEEGDTSSAYDAQDRVESPTSFTTQYNDTRNPNPTWDIGYRPRRSSGTSTGIDLPLPQSHARPHFPASQTSLPVQPISRGRTPSQRHRPTRSRSAPPFKTSFEENEGSQTPLSREPFSAGLDGPGYARRSYTTYSTTSSALSSLSSSFSNPSWTLGLGKGNKPKGGELLRPPPPLHRPTTFWRHTPRSGVTSSSFSPSTHVVRRSTFVAAGIPFERPMYDMSALGVESRVRTAIREEGGSKEVSTVFWEVVVQR